MFTQMSWKKLVSMLFLTWFSINLFQTACYAESYDDKIVQFFKLIQEDKPSEAIDFIYSENPWFSQKSDAIQDVKMKFTNMKSFVGNYNSYEKIFEHTIANRFVHISYFVAYDRQPLRFNFQFYKPKDQWSIYSFSFDDELIKELEESARLAPTSEASPTQ